MVSQSLASLTASWPCTSRRYLGREALEVQGVPSTADPPFPSQISTVGVKGDFLLVSDHLIELVTRLYQTFEAISGQALPLHITDRCGRGFGGCGRCGWSLKGRTAMGGVVWMGQDRAGTQREWLLWVGLMWVGQGGIEVEVEPPRVGHHMDTLSGCSRKPLGSGCNQGSSLGNEIMDLGMSPSHLSI